LLFVCLYANAAVLIVQVVQFQLQGDGVSTVMKFNPANLAGQQTPNLPLVGVASNPSPLICSDNQTGNQFPVNYSVAGGKLIVTFTQPPPNGDTLQCGVALTYTPQ